MTTKTKCEFYIAINEDGEYSVDVDMDDAATKLVEDAGGNMVRVIKLTAMIAAPQVIEAEVDVPDEAGETTEVTA